MKSSFIHKLIIVLVLGIFCTTSSGCWLLDKIEEIINSYYPQEKEISIVILPPYPLIDKEYQDEEDNIVEAFSNSDGVHDALIDGIAEFNHNKKGTTIKPRWFTEADEVVGFYRDVFTSLDQKKPLQEINKGKVRSIRRMANDDPTITCLIYGVFRYSPNQTAYSLTLVYYDYVANNTAVATGVVTAEPGSAQEKALQDLMKELLNKVYE